MPTPEGPAQQLPAQGAGSTGSMPNMAAGYRQGGTHGMQPQYPGTIRIQTGQNGIQRVTMEDLTQYYLSKMGSPEEYERRNPPSKVSKMFHNKETAVSTFLRRGYSYTWDRVQKRPQSLM